MLLRSAPPFPKDRAVVNTVLALTVGSPRSSGNAHLDVQHQMSSVGNQTDVHLPGATLPASPAWWADIIVQIVQRRYYPLRGSHKLLAEKGTENKSIERLNTKLTEKQAPGLSVEGNYTEPTSVSSWSS